MSRPSSATSQAPRPILPVGLRITALAMVLGSLLLASFYQVDSEADLDRGSALASRQLLFFDEGSGWISVRDAGDNAELLRLAPGEDGFMRGVMRSLVRERRARGFEGQTAFELVAWQSGHLSLSDPDTGRRVELSAFGPDNVQALRAWWRSGVDPCFLVAKPSRSAVWSRWRTRPTACTPT